MPSDAVVRTFPPFIRWALITTAITIGAGYAFGPVSFYSATSFDILKSISWFPISAWGFTFMFAGMLMASTRLVGYAIGVLAWGTWGFGLMVAAFNGLLTGWGGVVYPMFMVAICGYEVYRWGQRHLIQIRQQAEGR